MASEENKYDRELKMIISEIHEFRDDVPYYMFLDVVYNIITVFVRDNKNRDLVNALIEVLDSEEWSPNDIYSVLERWTYRGTRINERYKEFLVWSLGILKRLDKLMSGDENE